jgi:predicted HTH transcriptional regulator
VPVHFEFDERSTDELNPAWIEQLLAFANSQGGLRLVEEPPQPS